MTPIPPTTTIHRELKAFLIKLNLHIRDTGLGMLMTQARTALSPPHALHEREHNLHCNTGSLSYYF
jgi:hypothetical protein